MLHSIRALNNEDLTKQAEVNGSSKFMNTLGHIRNDVNVFFLLIESTRLFTEHLETKIVFF